MKTSLKKTKPCRTLAILLVLVLTLSLLPITAAALPSATDDFTDAFTADALHAQLFGTNNIPEADGEDPVNHRALFTLNGMDFLLSETGTVGAEQLYADENDVVTYSSDTTFTVTISGTTPVYSALLGIVAADGGGQYLPGETISVSVNGGTAQEHVTAALFENNAFLIVSDTPVTTIEIFNENSHGGIYYGLSRLILASGRYLPAVTFDANGGSVTPASARVDADGKLAGLPTPTKSGYSFDGWFTAATDGTQITADTVFTAGTTIYAHWTPATSTPSPPSTPLPGGSAVQTPEDSPPVTNPDGSVTLPGGGTITTPGGADIIAPPGTVIDANGDVNVPNGNMGADITQRGDYVHVDPGMTIEVPDDDLPIGDYRIYWKNPFDDVDDDDWFFDGVRFAYAHGFMNGTSETAFEPDAPITRGMMVTILYRVSESPDMSDTANPFSDVTDGQYYADAVKWAAENGIVLGYGDGTYGPNDPITREQMAAIFYRYMPYAGIAPPVTGQYIVFADEAQISGYAMAAIQTLYKLGVMKGTGDDAINPQGQATRAEAATMLHRLLTIDS